MKKRYLPQTEEAQDNTYQQATIPTDRPVAVYYRQSTDAQVGNISTFIQTVDMVEHLKRLGWDEDDIILIDMDEGISGTTKIDERPGMQMLFELISKGEIGVVACQDEDRLFRDVTQIQVNIFIEACRKSNVLVLTPTMTYDFGHEQTGTFHARQFRFKSEMAAEYISSVIRGKLHRAKSRLLNEGRWGGSGVPPGYMVDLRKSLPDGTPNPNWKRYVPFEPYAEIVRSYFDLFLQNAGGLNQTLSQIHEHGPFYPDPNICKPPQGFKVVYRMHRYGDFYAPGKGGLGALLTNASYLGHWMLKGQIIIWDNHEPLVDKDTFMKAFNYLSKVTLDGRPNPDYRPRQQNARPSLESERDVDRPLCAGMLVSFHQDEWTSVGTNWVSPLNHYTYTLWEPHMGGSRYVWSKVAEFVDDVVVRLLHLKLEATFETEYWEEILASLETEISKDSDRIKSQMEYLETVMQNQLASLDSLTTPELIQAIEKRYKEAKDEHNRLRGILETTVTKAEQIEAVYALRENYQSAVEKWDDLTQDEMRVILHAFIDRIEAQPVEVHGLELIIRWRDETSDKVVLPRQATTGTQWLPSQVDKLLSMWDSGASQIEIARTFRDRKWELIRNKITEIKGTGNGSIHPKPIYDTETYDIYLERTDGGKQKYKAGSGCRWQDFEIEELEEMIDTGATKLDLLKAFPHRNWGRIRAKVTEIRGKDCDVPGDKPFKRNETYPIYMERIGMSLEDGEDTATESENCNSSINEFTEIRGRNIDQH